MENIENIISALSEKCVFIWLDLYNSLSGESHSISDIPILSGYRAANASEQWKMDILKSNRDLLVQSGFFDGSESYEFKLATKNKLEQLLEKLQNMSANE